MSDLALHATAVSELDAYMRQAEMLAASTLVPAQYRNKPADILVASLAGREVGMGPWASLTYVVVIQGKATINAEGRVALIRKAGHSISGESTPDRAVAHGKRRDTGDEMTVEWTIDMAKRAGLDKSNSWKQYPEAMLWARAVSQLSRMLFADVLMGVSYDPEELGAQVSQTGEVIDVPAEPIADEGTHAAIRSIVANLPDDHREQFVGWYQDQGFPPIKQADRLTQRQAEAVLDHLDKLDRATPIEAEQQEASSHDEPTSVEASTATAAATSPAVTVPAKNKPSAAARAALAGDKPALGAVKRDIDAMGEAEAVEQLGVAFPNTEVVA